MQHALFCDILENDIWLVGPLSLFAMLKKMNAIRTDVVVETKKSSDELAFALHDHPDLRANTSVNEFWIWSDIFETRGALELSTEGKDLRRHFTFFRCSCTETSSQKRRSR